MHLPRRRSHRQEAKRVSRTAVPATREHSEVVRGTRVPVRLISYALRQHAVLPPAPAANHGAGLWKGEQCERVDEAAAAAGEADGEDAGRAPGELVGISHVRTLEAYLSFNVRYGEDMTPMQYWPHTANSHGYVDARVVERMWMDRFEWLQRERDEMMEEREEMQAAEIGMDEELKAVEEMNFFSLILHPDTSGMAHVIGMVERFLEWVRRKGEGEVEWCTCGDVAERWKGMQGDK